MSQIRAAIGRTIGARYRLALRRRRRLMVRAVLAGVVSVLVAFPLGEMIRGPIQWAGLTAIDRAGWVPHQPGYQIGFDAGWSVRDLKPSDATLNALWIASVGLTLMPALWLALFVYHRLVQRWVWLDGTTRCGHCGHLLCNLVEPRCQACGRGF